MNNRYGAMKRPGERKRLRFARWRPALGLALLLALGVAATALAEAGGYRLDWFSIDGGGAVVTTGSGYALSGTAGQPDASPLRASGGYALSGGFWPGSPETAVGYGVYLPLVWRGP